jgi:glutamate synthase (NADPH/NADH) small chain
MVPVGKPEVVKTDIVLLAMGFLKPQLPVVGENVFFAGDVQSGASLVVRAMASGHVAAEALDTYCRKK